VKPKILLGIRQVSKLSEIDVVFNRDGSYSEMIINKVKKHLSKLEEGGSKIYNVTHSRWWSDMDGNFVNKTYAEYICRIKNEEIKKKNAGKTNYGGEHG
jgi:hypothetical protein